MGEVVLNGGAVLVALVLTRSNLTRPAEAEDLDRPAQRPAASLARRGRTLPEPAVRPLTLGVLRSGSVRGHSAGAGAMIVATTATENDIVETMERDPLFIAQ